MLSGLSVAQLAPGIEVMHQISPVVWGWLFLAHVPLGVAYVLGREGDCLPPLDLIKSPLTIRTLIHISHQRAPVYRPAVHRQRALTQMLTRPSRQR
jgi:hypothetical protein